MCERHCGYQNYQTFAVSLELDNNRASYEYWRQRAREIAQYATRREAIKFLLADEIKLAMEDSNPLDEEGGVYGALLNSALSMVNWGEVAESFLEEVV